MKLGLESQREAPLLLGRLNPLGPYAPRVPTFLASHPIHLPSLHYNIRNIIMLNILVRK